MSSKCEQLKPRPGYHGPAHRGHARCARAARRAEARDRQAGYDARCRCGDEDCAAACGARPS